MKKLALLLTVLLLLSACAPAPSPTPVRRFVTYKVGGTARAASLTYETPLGSEQRDVVLPWRKEFKAETGQFLYLSAQADGHGEISCEILVNGKPYKKADSEGDYVIATCSGKLE